MAITKLKGRQLSFAGAGAFTGSSGAANGVILDNGSGLILSASRVYLERVPQEDLEAATKSYVDAQTGTGGVASRGIVFGDPDGTGFSSNNAFVVDSGYDGTASSGPFDVQFSSTTGSFSINAKSFQVTGSANNAQAIAFVTNQGSNEKITFTNTQGDDDGAITLAATAGGILLDQDSASKKIHLDSEGDVDIDAVKGLTITNASAAGGDDLTIEQTGDNDSSVIITAAGTGADAIKIDATAGSMVIGPNLADQKTLTLGKTGATAMVFTPHDTPANEKISLTNTAGTENDAIKIFADAGGITLEADSTDASAIDIDSAGGFDVDAAGAVAIDSTAGSITVGALLADAQTLKLGKNGATEMVFTPHGTAGSEKISLTNTSGTAVDAIAIAASAGGLALTAKNAASKFTVEGAALTLSGSGVNIDGENDEVDITTAGALDLNGAAVTIDGSTSVAVTGAGASSFKTSAGDLTIEAEANDSAVVIKGDHEGGTAIHLDGNQNAASVVLIDAGELDVNASGGINITSTENAADAVVINSGQGGIDITAAGAAGEDIDITNSAGSVNITAGEADGDGIVINANHATSGINMQLAGNLVASVNPRGFVVAENQALVSDGATLALTGALVTRLPKYFYNQATVTSGTLDTNFGRVVAGDGILSASVAGSTNLAKGISLLTSSLRIMGGGPGTQTMLVPESLQIYQNGLLLTSGVNADYEIVNYNYLSSSVRGLDIKLNESGVVGDVYTVFLQSQMKGD